MHGTDVTSYRCLLSTMKQSPLSSCFIPVSVCLLALFLGMTVLRYLQDVPEPQSKQDFPLYTQRTMFLPISRPREVGRKNEAEQSLNESPSRQ